MGLSHPIKSKVLERYGNEKFKVGICSMQGFRPSNYILLLFLHFYPYI